MPRTLSDLRQTAVDLQSRATALQAKADAEERDYTPQEASEFDQLTQDHARVLVDIGRRQTLEDMQSTLDAPAAPRIAPPLVPTNIAPMPKANGRPITNGAGQRIEVVSRSLGTHGFLNFGEFAQAVRNVCSGGRPDPRLLNSAGPPDAMTEGTAADGGYAVPPDFRPDIQMLIEGEDSLLPYTDQLTTSSNAVTVPVDATSPWQSSGGIQAYWGAEAALKTSSKAVLAQVNCRLFKLYVLVPASDELVEDAPALGTLIRTKAPQKMIFKLNRAIINGSGTGQPLGIVNSGAAITIPRGTPGTVTMADILKMWGACYGPSRRRAVWICNQDIEASLMGLFFPIPPTGTATGGWPIYLPPGGLSAAPFGTLLGRPVLVSEAANDLGVTGDLILADLKSYLTATKAGGMQQAFSIHLWFDWDVSCFRITWRLGGVPWWTAPVTSLTGAKSRSPFVVLGGTTAPPSLLDENPEGQVHPHATTSRDVPVTPQSAVAEGRKRMRED